MDQAQGQQEGEAEGVVVEIQRRRSRTCRDHHQQSRPRDIGPANDVGFDEPVEVMIAVDEREQAGEPGVELQAGNAEQPAQRRTDIAEIVLRRLGKARDPDLGRRRRQQNGRDGDEIDDHQRPLNPAFGLDGAERHEHQREQRNVNQRRDQDPDDGK
jgi:hypothetical protein